MIDRLIRASGDIDFYVVNGEKPEAESRSKSWVNVPERHSDWAQYAAALVIVALVTGVDLLAATSFSLARLSGSRADRIAGGAADRRLSRTRPGTTGCGGQRDLVELPVH